MPAIRKLSGVWRGRLVDIQGFEGDLQFTLKGDDNGQLRGTFTVDIGSHHSTVRRQGELQGRGDNNRVRLALAARDNDVPVKISLDADLLDLRDGGTGLRGTYEVSARGYSPLQGGIVSASTNRRGEDEVATVSQKPR